MSQLNINFGQRLKEIRESRGLSQEKLALSEDSVGNMERGKHWPLNVKPKDLFNF